MIDKATSELLQRAGHGEDNAAPLIQHLLDRRGDVEIPSGTYLLSATLRVHSGTHIVAAPDAVFRLADGVGQHCRDFMITNANPGNGNANIVLEGGLWDANSAGNPRGKDHEPFSYTGVAINFTNVRNLAISNLTVHNPESFFIRIGEVSDFIVENIRLTADNVRLNNDGVHVGGFSEHGVIRNIHAAGVGVPNDDMVALNADDDVERQLNRGMRRGPIRDILVEDITAEDAYTFVRLLSVDQPIEDITIRRLNGSCRVHGINLNNWRFPRGVGVIRRVTLEDVDLAKTKARPPELVKISLSVDGFTIRNLCRRAGTLSEVKTLVVDNLQDLEMICDGKKDAVKAADGYAQAGGSIGELRLNAH